MIARLSSETHVKFHNSYTSSACPPYLIVVASIAQYSTKTHLAFCTKLKLCVCLLEVIALAKEDNNNKLEFEEEEEEAREEACEQMRLLRAERAMQAEQRAREYEERAREWEAYARRSEEITNRLVAKPSKRADTTTTTTGAIPRRGSRSTANLFSSSAMPPLPSFFTRP